MDDFQQKHEEILKEYARPVMHIRDQFNKNRFGLVFGAGLSKSFGLPTWSKLVESIAGDEDVQGKELLKQSSPRGALSYKTEMLYQHFKKRKHLCHNANSINSREFDFEAAGEWLNIVRRHLYRGTDTKMKASFDSHPYLSKLLPIIKKSHMTVTYNFDDFIEQAIIITRTKKEKQASKGYEIVTNPWSQFKRDQAIIYHPNGVVPSMEMETPSDSIIFLESSFADQILGHSNGEDTGLLNHLSKKTCLFIGLSLEDETLRALLAKNAKKNPGNYHYYVMFTGNDDYTLEHKEAIKHTNFRVYNLITLFLNDEEIACIADLINLDENSFIDYAAECGVNGAIRCRTVDCTKVRSEVPGMFLPVPTQACYRCAV